MRRPAVDETAVAASLTALTDPTRRAVVALLAHGPRRAGDLAAALSTTPPSLSRHLRILRRSGLVDADDVDDDARVRLYRLRPDSLAPLRGWIDEIEAFRGDQLAAFKAHVERSPSRGGDGRG